MQQAAQLHFLGLLGTEVIAASSGFEPADNGPVKSP